MLHLRPWAAVHGQRWRWPPQLGVKWAVNHKQYRTVLVFVCSSVCMWQDVYSLLHFYAVLPLSLHNACMNGQEIMCVRVWGCALCNCYVCFHANICMCTWAHAGHPDAARPDVQESGLCGVMSGSLADSADLEQCAQVSPTNELSI